MYVPYGALRDDWIADECGAASGVKLHLGYYRPSVDWMPMAGRLKWPLGIELALGCGGRMLI